MYNILVSGVGAIIGYGIINSLRTSKYKVNIIGVDIYKDAVGQKWCDYFEQAPPLSRTEEYKTFLKNTINKYNIDLIIPGFEQEIYWMVKNIDFTNKLNAKVILNNVELIRLSNDKWLTYKELEKNGFKIIKSYIDGNYKEISIDLGEPMLLKPRKSYASKGIVKLYNEEDYNYWKRKLKNDFMVQEIVGKDDEEYTVGCFGTGDGNYTQAIIFKRKLSGEGATSKAKTITNLELKDEVTKLVKILKPIGPTNLQFRYHKGRYLLLEINPRISSSTSIRTSFGYNEAEMSIEYFLEGKIPPYRDLKDGYGVRYIKDCIVYDSNNF